MLYTDRLMLRDLEQDDFSAVHAYSSDLEVVRYMWWGPNNEQQTGDYLKNALKIQKEQPRRLFEFALVKQTDNQLIGSCTLSLGRANPREAEVGYILNRSFWNQGYTTEAVAKLIWFGFVNLKLHRIYGICDPENIASFRVMEHCNMRREGHFIENRFIKEKWCDTWLYALLDREYSSG